MEGKVAVLGDADFVMPFSALGLDIYPVTGQAGDIAEKARSIIEGNYALVVVAENTAPAAQQVFSLRQNEPVPCIVIVPFTTEPTGFAVRSLNRALRMATGVDIFANDK